MEKSSDLLIQDKKSFQEGILKVENNISKIPGTVTGKEADKMCPLKHTFVDGMYMREIFMPKGTLIVSKIHKFKHPYFVLKGETSVLTEKGIQRIKAPYSGITERGTKRLLYIHEDTIWVTIHATKSRDIDIIEEEIIAKTFNDLYLDEDKIKSLCVENTKKIEEV